MTLTVVDDSPGIPDIERRPIERGYESPLEHATGLGIWRVRWTVSASDGTVDITQNEPRGSVVSVYLPRNE